MNRCLYGLALAFLWTSTARAQVAPDKALATFTVAEGLELSLFAAEPMLVNPTSIDIDHKGRVWVCEAVNYRRKNFGRPILRKEGDRIVILEDTKGAGKADRVHVFYQSLEIIAPLGIAVAPYPDGKGQRVYVCQSPDILVFEDKDGDLKADGPPKKLLTGFRGIDHDHGVHGINIGPDGKLYFTVGDSGVQNLQSADGKGKKWTSNSTDVRAGTVWRCDMDGKNLELIAHNFRNNYECCVNSFGDIWLSDNDDDGNQQTRICYVMPGGNYGYHPRGPGQTHWHEEQPGVVHKVLRTGFGSPCGICFYEGSLLPRKYQGQLLHADAGPREVRAFHLKAKGAGYEAEKEVLVTSKDTWFRPSDVCVAPDGSIFIADWYDPGVGGHGMGDWTRGRIYRLTPKGHRGYKIPKLDVSRSGFLDALRSPNLATRNLAYQTAILGPEGPLGIKAPSQTEVRQGVEAEDPILRGRSLWLAEILDGSLPRPRVTALKDSDDRIRQQSVRLHAAKDPKQFSDEFNRKQWREQPASTRREVLLGVRSLDVRSAVLIIEDLAKLHDGKDRFYLNAIGIAVGTDLERRKVILADFEKHFPEWNDRVADLVCELRPPSMLPKMGKLLSDQSLGATQRARIIDILAASDDLVAGQTMIGLVVGDYPAEIKIRALENLKLFLPTKWSALKKSDELKKAADTLVRSSKSWVVGMQLIAVAELVEYVDRLQDIATKPEDAIVRRTAIQTLGQLRSTKAVEALVALIEKDVHLAECARALGEQVAGRANEPAAKMGLDALLRLLGHTEANVAIAALNGLTGSQPGTATLLAMREKNTLPERLIPDAGRLLRNSPYQGLRNKAMLLFPAPGKINPKKLPPITALVKRTGNVQRGKQIFAASAKNDMLCAKCHTVHGLGGSIGPDLSMIGKKASRENLLESILLPSKAVADQYINWNIETGKGQVLNGLIVEETPDHLLLRDGNGKDTKLLKKDIESRKKGDKSLMPEDIIVFLTEDDLLDLTEYMLTLRTAALSVPAWHIIGPFDNIQGDEGLDKVYPPEKEVNLRATYPGKLGKIGWRTAQSDSTGYVDLRQFHGGAADQTVSYLYREIASPAEQEATILLGNDDGVKLWLNGEKVHEDRRHNAATAAASQVKVKLKKGVNRVLLKLNNGDGPHGFYFTMLTEQELK